MRSTLLMKEEASRRGAIFLIWLQVSEDHRHPPDSKDCRQDGPPRFYPPSRRQPLMWPEWIVHFPAPVQTDVGPRLEPWSAPGLPPLWTDWLIPGSVVEDFLISFFYPQICLRIGTLQEQQSTLFGTEIYWTITLTAVHKDHLTCINSLTYCDGNDSISHNALQLLSDKQQKNDFCSFYVENSGVWRKMRTKTVFKSKFMKSACYEHKHRLHQLCLFDMLTCQAI